MNGIRKRMTAVVASVLVLVLATGCDEIGVKAKETIGNTTDNIQKSVETIVNQEVEKLKQNSESVELSASAPVDSATELRLNNAVGNIEVNQIEGSDITVQVNIWSAKQTSHKKDIERVFEQATVSIKSDGKTLHVVTNAKDDPEMDLWDWAHKKYRFSEFSIDYIIGLPAGVEHSALVTM